MTIQHMLLSLGGVVEEYTEPPVPPPTPGIALSWGCNSAGLLGDNNVLNKSSPGLVAGGFTDWIQVSAGRTHSLGVRENGTAWAWGYGGIDGKLGDNSSSVIRCSPVQVAGGFTDWAQISSGRDHSLGVRANGTAWGWGAGFYGRIGDNTAISKSSPVQVVGGFTDWAQLSAGGNHSLGVRANGTAWSWGNNNGGRLGDGTTTNRSSPVQVAGGFTDWTQVSAGSAHGLGVRANGTAWSWGINSSGILGDGSITTRCSPVQVVGGFTDWTQVSSLGHSLGVRADGTAWAWGCSACGQLGDNQTNFNRCSPVQVVGGFTDWTQVSAGSYHSLGFRANGTAWAWGRNQVGQLGDNTIVNKSSPVQVAGGFTNWIEVSAGSCISTGIRQTS